MSIFQDIVGGLGSAAEFAGKVIKALPGIGAPLSAGLTASGAIMQGGSVTTTVPGQGSTSMGKVPAPNKAGIFGQLLEYKILGIPVWAGAAGLVMFGILFHGRAR